uniref:Deoxyribonuclease-2-alpha n=1 Tax=Haplochromis burtoni TaxID=8153 RepID=A0A3Q2UYV1_HAPBU
MFCLFLIRFIIYKAPGEIIPRSNPRRYNNKMNYLYIDSANSKSYIHNRPGYKNLKDPSGALAHTLRPILKKIRNMVRPLVWSSNGVIMVERERAGVWLLHSTPQFPFRRDQNNFWPESGLQLAQTFICVTFNYNQFIQIGKHLQYIRAFPFEHDIPDDFHQELIDATKRVEVPPSSDYQTLRSRGGLSFYSIAKQQLQEPDGDLYHTIARAVQSHVYVQTWGCQKDRADSDCSDTNHVYNIKTIKKVLGPASTWSPTKDHSKWCVTNSESNREWTCIADVNRAQTQYQRRGGALCIVNRDVRNKFWEFAREFDECNESDRNAFASRSLRTHRLNKNYVNRM